MKRFAALMMAVGILCMSTACDLVVKNTEEQFDYPVTVGNIVLSEAPGSIAVLSPNLTDVILACGYEGKLTARSDNCDHEAVAILPSVGTPDDPDMQKLGELGVDLILTDICFSDDVSRELEDRGISVLVMKPAPDIDELAKLYNNAASVIAGSYTGKMRAMTAFEQVRGGLETIKQNVSGDGIITPSCYIYDVTEDECTVANGSDFIDQLFEYASVANVSAADDDGVIGIDTLLKANPETIFCDEGVYEKLTANKDLKSLKALTKGTVYELPREYAERQGMTCIQTADFIAAKTHRGYVQTQPWPDELAEKKQEYKPPFEPKKDIFYTIGETYEPIKAIEERLIGLGYLEGSADTTFSQNTADAVSAFQTANDLPVTGIADYDTLKKLLSSEAVSADEAGEVTFTAE